MSTTYSGWNQWNIVSFLGGWGCNLPALATGIPRDRLRPITFKGNTRLLVIPLYSYCFLILFKVDRW